MVLPVYEDKNLAKESEENDKKLIGSLDRSKRERKKFLKKFESDRSRENSRFLKNSLYDFRLIEN